MNRTTDHPRRSGRLDRRAVLSTLAVGAVATGVALVPQSSDAAPGDSRRVAASASSSASASAAASASATAAASGPTSPADQVSDPPADPANETAPGQGVEADTGAGAAVAVNPTSTEQPVGQQPVDGRTAPAQDFLGDSCEGSDLQPHQGLQQGGLCVRTAFGEVGREDRNPSLIIASAPRVVRANRPFDLRVSTRNLVRDRFLAAAAGGYYKESSFLDEQGLVRGHFHTACRTLTGRRSAPDPAPAPAFFAATEDGGGGTAPDTVTVRIPGLPRGEAQCAVWAGDGSHRVPMMQRANQIPAFDVVRILVR